MSSLCSIMSSLVTDYTTPLEGVALQNAMNVVQISKEDQEQSFEMLSAILWLGNIAFGVVEYDNHAVVDENEGNYYLRNLSQRLDFFVEFAV